MDPEDPDADAGQEAGEHGHDEGDQDRLWHAARAVDERRRDEAGHRGHGADRQVDATGEHRDGLAAGQDRQWHRRPDHDVRPPRTDDARVDDVDDQDEDAEQADQRDDRAIPEQPLARRRRLASDRPPR